MHKWPDCDGRCPYQRICGNFIKHGELKDHLKFCHDLSDAQVQSILEALASGTSLGIEPWWEQTP
jgi:hypothetical protein